jgi:TPR repeat protein
MADLAAAAAAVGRAEAKTAYRRIGLVKLLSNRLKRFVSIENSNVRLNARAIAFPIFLAAFAQPAFAQSSIEMRTIARQSSVAGAPDITIDLTTPATQKYAVVIGNSNYDHVPGLKNAGADAKIVAEYLRSSSYSVAEFIDLDKGGFESLLRQILFDVSTGSEVVFYYAGHGIQIGQTNYLIPTDAKLDSAYDVPFEAVSLTSLMSIIGARTRSLVAILDSCRDNPFAGREAVTGLADLPRETQQGFSPQNTPINSLLVFSTAPGAVAFDGDGDNSPFTAALIDVATKDPDKPVDEVMQEVRRRVYHSTDGLQIPWESSSLVETVYLSDHGQFETVVASQESTQSANSASDPTIPATVSISIPLGPNFKLGRALTQSLTLGADAQFRIKEEPSFGRLELAANGTSRGLSLVTQGVNLVNQIIYNSRLPQQAANKLESQTVSDQLVVEVNGTSSVVSLDVEIDPCDFHAGDYLDPEGVGVARYPNEIETVPALEACLAAVGKSPKIGRFHYQLGRVYVALRQVEKAEEEYLLARDLGHTRAWNALGSIEVAKLQETGGALSEMAPDSALSYFATGVEKGDPYAFHSLGRQLLLNSEGLVRRNQGFELLTRALELGHTFSMNTLGIYFLEENTDHFSPERGLRYLRESAAREDIYGYQNMGFVTLNGLGGLKKDPQAAYEWFVKASDEGHPTAPTSVGRMYTNGQVAGGVNYSKAISWYDQGLERGDPWGGSNAAWIIHNEKPSGFDLGQAAIRAAKAATLRNKDAASEARSLLAEMSPREINAGAQLLINELGGSVAADGAFGSGSQSALNQLATRFSTPFSGQGSQRLEALAKVFWQNSKFRSDLY